MATTTAHPFDMLHAPLHPMRHLLRAVWLQALRRNEAIVIGMLMSLYLFGAIVLRIVGIDTEATARFVAGLGLQLGATLAALLAILTAARQLPEELERRTIYPVLAKPVSRLQVLGGKLLAAWLLAAGALALFWIATLAIVPAAAGHFVTFAEALALRMLALGVAAATAGWLALHLPLAVALLCAGTIYFGGQVIANLMERATWLAPFARLVPDLSVLDLTMHAIDGGVAMGAIDMLTLCAYGAAWVIAFVTLATIRFRRMAL